MHSERVREVYWRGLCWAVSRVATETSFSTLLLRLWGRGILGELPMNTEGTLEDAKKSVSRQREGLSFFSLKHPFLFDALSLAEALSTDRVERLRQILADEVCGLSSKSALAAVSDVFTSGNDCAKVPAESRAHRGSNLRFIEGGFKKVLVCGNVGAGKSSVINALAGRRLLMPFGDPGDSRPVLISNSLERDYVLLGDGDRYAFVPAGEEEASDLSAYTRIGVAFTSACLRERPIAFIDGKGFNAGKAEVAAVSRDLICSGEYDLLVYVSNGQYFGTTDEHGILTFLHDRCDRPIFFLLNKLDQFHPGEDSIAKMVDDYRRNLAEVGFRTPDIVPLSSRAALLFRSERPVEDVLAEKNYLSAQFAKPYYDLPRYVLGEASSSPEESTGILLLEKSIVDKLAI